jgi:hypothetical protein
LSCAHALCLSIINVPEGTDRIAEIVLRALPGVRAGDVVTVETPWDGRKVSSSTASSPMLLRGAEFRILAASGARSRTVEKHLRPRKSITPASSGRISITKDST